MADDTRTKHLEMIQSVIARMAGNQFQLRAWSVALATAVIGYAAGKDNNAGAALLAVIPVVVFWLQDAYYLALERRYRELFNEVRRDSGPVDFHMTFTELGAADLWDALKRPAVVGLHFPMVVLALIVATRGAR